jgi:hypothetical protein
MSATFVIDLVDINGNAILPDVAFTKLDYSRGFATVGSMNVVLGPGYDPGQFERDSNLRIWRTPQGGGTALEASGIWFVRSKEIDLNTGIITLGCEDQMGLLKRRIVGYRSQTILADHAIDGTYDPMEAADDMMKAYVRENMGADAVWPVGGAPDTDRNLEPYFIVEDDKTLAPIVNETASMKTVFDTLKSIRDKAREATPSTELFFDVKANANGVFEFRTLIGSLGLDQQDAIGGLIFSVENNSLTKATLTWDWEKELTYAYIGVGGHTSSHDVQRYPASDGRDTANHWNRIETYIAGEETTTVSEQALSVVEAARPKIVLNAQTVDTPDIKYGIHYFYGDSVWVQAAGYTFLCHIHSIKNRVSDGNENPVVNLVGEIPTAS